MNNNPLDDLDLSGLETAFTWPASRRRAVWSSPEQTTIDASRTANAVALIKRLPRPAETLTCIMDATFNMADLLPAFIDLAGQPCRHAVIFTLGWNCKTSGLLAALLKDQRIGAADVIASKYFSGADRIEFERGQAELIAAGARVVSARSHCKIILMDFSKIRVTATGSGNFRTCVCLEQLTITTAPAPFKLFANLADNIFQNPKAYE